MCTRSSIIVSVKTHLDSILRWLEVTVLKPLEGTWFDKWIATPAKDFYIGVKRLE